MREGVLAGKPERADPGAYTAPPAGRVSSARTVIVLLYLGYLLSYGDRVIFGLLLKPIKDSLGFTDSQLGLLVGAAFAITYAVFSPLGGFSSTGSAARPSWWPRWSSGAP